MKNKGILHRGYKRFFTFLIFFCIYAVFLSLSPFFNIKLNALVTANQQSSTQLFYSIKSKGYSEGFSTTKFLYSGKNNVDLLIPFSLDNLRWDISDRDGEYTVVNARVTFLGFSWPITRRNYNIGNDIESISEINQGIHLKVTDGSRDPILYLDLDMKKIFLMKVGIITLISGLLSVAVLNGRKFKSVVNNLDQLYISYVRYLKNISIGNISIAIPFLIFSAMGCLLYISFVTNFSLSIDDEFAAVRMSPDGWVGQGRWSIYLITRYLFTFPAIPFLPYVFFAGCLALSYILVVILFEGNIGLKSYFLYPIFSFFPTWWCISEFYANVPSVAIGCIVTAIATVLIINHREHFPQPRNFSIFYLLPILLLAFAYGTYQSYFLLFVAIYLSWTVLRLLDGKEHFHLKSHVITFIFISFSSLFSYFILSKLFQLVIPTASGYSEYINSYLNLQAIFNKAGHVLSTLMYQMYLVYSGNEVQYGYAIYFAPVIIMLPVFMFLNAPRRNLLITLYLLIILSPFALIIIGGGIVMPLRTLVSLPFVFWFAAWILIRKADNKILASIAFTITAVFQTQILTTTSQYIVTATLTQQNDRLLADALNNEMQRVSGDTNNVMRVDFFGYKPFSSIYPSALSSTTQASFFSWDNGDIFRIVTYMNVLGYRNIIPVHDPKERQSFISTFEKMPVWPLEGSVRIVGNTLLVKLGQQADPAHSK